MFSQNVLQFSFFAKLENLIVDLCLYFDFILLLDLQDLLSVFILYINSFLDFFEYE